MEKERIVNEYNCNSCNKYAEVVLNGYNNEEIYCPFCASDDIQFMGAFVIR